MEMPQEPKYSGLPRRYEDTKPALEQFYTHRSILSVGEKILGKFEAHSAEEKEKALKDCERRVWKEAEQYKNNCVEEALQKAAYEESLRVEEFNRQHQLHLQSEVERLTELFRQQIIDERFEERKNGERLMQDMTEELQKKHELEKLAAIKATVLKERGIGENALQEMMKRHEENLRAFSEEMEQAKNAALKALQYKLDDLRDEAVRQARAEEQNASDFRHQELQNDFTEEVLKLKTEISELLNEKSRLSSNLDEMTSDRDKFIGKYERIRDEFTKFIEQCRPDFGPGQVDYILPPY